MMRDVVVIGGGLGGLAAVRELASIGLSCSLIEVQRQLGGSMGSVQVGDFVFDSGPMRHPLRDPDYFLAYVRGLPDWEADAVHIDADGQAIFADGTGAFVAALKQDQQATVMLRMAVSSLGFLDSEDQLFAVCLENGILMAARAIIIAAPARYAERMLYTLAPDVALRLLDYRYDNVAYVSLGYVSLPAPGLNPDIPDGYPLTRIAMCDQGGRVPTGGLIVQAGLRFEPMQGLPADPVGEITALMGWPPNPDADHVHHWPESDPVMWRDADHVDVMRNVRSQLPQGVALAGSDYIASAHPPTLDERILSGINAASQVMRWLRYL